MKDELETLERGLEELARLENVAKPERKRHRWSMTTRLFVLGVTLIAVASSALAAVTLFTHTAPSVNVPVAVVTSTCSTLRLLALNAVQSVGGFATFSCSGTLTSTAIVAGSTGSATFALSLGGWTSVWLYSNVTQPGSGCSGATQLTGTSFAFTSGINYNYCAIVPAGVPSPLAFIVTWSQ